MKKITTFIKKHYKKILCAITCSVIAFCSVFALIPTSVNAGSSVTNLQNFYKTKFTEQYFNENTNSIFSGTNVKVESSQNFSFGYYTYADFDKNNAYEYFEVGKPQTTAFMRKAKGVQDNIVISSNFTNKFFTLTYNNIALPISSEFTFEDLSNANNFKAAFIRALSEWLQYKYLYMEYLPDDMAYTLKLSSVQMGSNSSVDYKLLTFSHENVGNLTTLNNIFYSDIVGVDNKYIENYSYYNIYDYVANNVDLNTNAFIVIPYLSISCTSLYENNAIYFVDYKHSKYEKFYDYGFQNCLSAFYLYGENIINYETIYNLGYDTGFNYASNLNNEFNGPFDVLFSAVERFLDFEIFPSNIAGVEGFKVSTLFLLGLGVAIVSIILKLAFGG